MALSLHVVVDNATNEQLDMALDYLIVTKQKVVNIAAGSQIDRGMQFVERVRQALPDIDIIWRILEDTGIHAAMSVNVWWTTRVAPFLAWMKKNRVIMLLDNESSGDDAVIKYYVQWELDAMNRLHKEGLGAAVARFATGNIDDGGNSHNQYPLLKPLLDAVTNKDYVSPNEYTNTTGLSSAGNIGRWKLIEAVAGRKLPISIGEAGILHKYEANNGWQGHMSEQQVVDALLADEQYYRPDITRSIFAVGGYQQWKTLQVTQGIINLLKQYYKEHPIMATPPQDIIILIVADGTKFRQAPSTSAPVITKLNVGTVPATMYPDATVVANGYTWLSVSIGGQAGYIAKEVIKVEPAVPNVPSPGTNEVSLDKYTLDDAKTLLTEIIEDSESLAAKARAILIKLQTAH